MHFFKLNSDEKSKIISDYKKEYSDWRDNSRKINKPFFMIHTDFEQLFLKELSAGSLKLYLYLGFRSKYQTGESWESIEDMALFFEKDSRTISNWLKELEDHGLIERKQKGYKNVGTTFLRPYGFFFEEIPIFPPPNLTTTNSYLEKISSETQSDLSMVLILNYNFKEYTVLYIFESEKENVYKGFYTTYFIKDYENLIEELKQNFKSKKTLKIDNYDIDHSIASSPNSVTSVYNNFLSYFKENIEWKKAQSVPKLHF